MSSQNPPGNGSNGNGSNGNGADEHYALELRAEVLNAVSAASEVRRGQLDRLETGSGSGRNGSVDMVAGTESVVVGGDLIETVGRERTNNLSNLTTTVHGHMSLEAHAESFLMTGTFNETHRGGELLVAGMSDNLIGGIGVRTTAPADMWLNGLIGMEEKLATANNDVLMMDVYAVGMEREFGTSIHNMAVSSIGGKVYTTAATGFMQLHKIQRGLRNTVPGGDAGGSSSPSGQTPPPSDGGASSAAGGAGQSVLGGARAAGDADNLEDVGTLRRLAETENVGTQADELVHVEDAASARHTEGAAEVENTLSQVGELVQLDDAENARYLTEITQVENVVNQNVTDMLESVQDASRAAEDATTSSDEAATAGEDLRQLDEIDEDPYEQISDWRPQGPDTDAPDRQHPSEWTSSPSPPEPPNQKGDYTDDLESWRQGAQQEPPNQKGDYTDDLESWRQGAQQEPPNQKGDYTDDLESWRQGMEGDGRQSAEGGGDTPLTGENAEDYDYASNWLGGGDGDGRQSAEGGGDTPLTGENAEDYDYASNWRGGGDGDGRQGGDGDGRQGVDSGGDGRQGASDQDVDPDLDDLDDPYEDADADGWRQGMNNQDSGPAPDADANSGSTPDANANNADANARPGAPAADASPGTTPPKKLPERTDVDGVMSRLKEMHAKTLAEVQSGEVVMTLKDGRKWTDKLKDGDIVLRAEKLVALEFAMDMIQRGEDPLAAMTQKMDEIYRTGGPNFVEKASGWELAMGDIDGVIKANQRPPEIPNFKPVFHTDEEAFPGETFSAINFDQKHANMAKRDEAQRYGGYWNRFKLLFGQGEVAPVLPARTDDMFLAADGSDILSSSVPGYVGGTMMFDTGIGNTLTDFDRFGNVVEVRSVNASKVRNIKPETAVDGTVQKIVKTAEGAFDIEIEEGGGYGSIGNTRPSGNAPTGAVQSRPLPPPPAQRPSVSPYASADDVVPARVGDAAAQGGGAAPPPPPPRRGGGGGGYSTADEVVPARVGDAAAQGDSAAAPPPPPPRHGDGAPQPPPRHGGGGGAGYESVPGGGGAGYDSAGGGGGGYDSAGGGGGGYDSAGGGTSAVGDDAPPPVPSHQKPQKHNAVDLPIQPIADEDIASLRPGGPYIDSNGQKFVITQDGRRMDMVDAPTYAAPPPPVDDSPFEEDVFRVGSDRAPFTGDEPIYDELVVKPSAADADEDIYDDVIVRPSQNSPDAGSGPGPGTGPGPDVPDEDGYHEAWDLRQKARSQEDQATMTWLADEGARRINLQADGEGADNVIPGSRPPDAPTNPAPQMDATGAKWKDPVADQPPQTIQIVDDQKVIQVQGEDGVVHTQNANAESRDATDWREMLENAEPGAPNRYGEADPGALVAGAGNAPPPPPPPRQVVPVADFKVNGFDDTWGEMMQRREMANHLSKSTSDMAANGKGLNKRAYTTLQTTVNDLDKLMTSMLEAHLTALDEAVDGSVDIPAKLDALESADITVPTPSQFLDNNPGLRMNSRDLFISTMEGIEDALKVQGLTEVEKANLNQQLYSMQGTLNSFDNIANRRMEQALTEAEQFANWKGLPLRDNIDASSLQRDLAENLMNPSMERLEDLIRNGMVDDVAPTPANIDRIEAGLSNKVLAINRHTSVDAAKLEDIQEAHRGDVVTEQYRVDLYTKAMEALLNDVNPLPYLQEEIIHAGSGLPIGGYMNEDIFDLRAFVDDPSVFHKIAGDVFDDVNELMTSDIHKISDGDGAFAADMGYLYELEDLGTHHLSNYDVEDPAHLASRRLILRTQGHIEELVNIRFQETMEAIGKTDVPAGRLTPVEVRNELFNISEELFIAGEFDKAWEVQKTIDELDFMVPNMINNSVATAQSLSKTLPPALPEGVDVMDVINKLTKHQDAAHERALELLQEVDEANELANQANELSGTTAFALASGEDGVVEDVGFLLGASAPVGNEVSLIEAADMARLELAEAAYQRSMLYSAMIEDVQNGFDPSYIIDGYIKQAEQAGADAEEMSQLYRMQNQVQSALGVYGPRPLQNTDLLPDTGLAPVVSPFTGNEALDEGIDSARRGAIAQWLEDAANTNTLRAMRGDVTANVLSGGDGVIRLDFVGTDELINKTMDDLARLQTNDIDYPRGDMAAGGAQVETVDAGSLAPQTVEVKPAATSTTTAAQEGDDLGHQFDLLFDLSDDPQLEKLDDATSTLTEAEQARQIVASAASENDTVIKIQTEGIERPAAVEPPPIPARSVPPPVPPRIRHDAIDPRTYTMNYLLKVGEAQPGGSGWGNTSLLDWDAARARQIRNNPEMFGVINDGWKMVSDLNKRMQAPNYVLTEFDVRLVRFMGEQSNISRARFVSSGGVIGDAHAFGDWFKALLASDALDEVENSRLLDQITEAESLEDLHHGEELSQADESTQAEDAQHAADTGSATSTSTRPPPIPPKTFNVARVERTDPKVFGDLWTDLVRKGDPIQKRYLHDANAEVPGRWGHSIDSNGAMQWMAHKSYEACRNRILDLADDHFAQHADLLGLTGEASVTAIDRRWLEADNAFEFRLRDIVINKIDNASMDNAVAVYNQLQEALNSFDELAREDITETLERIDALQQQPGTYINGQVNRDLYNQMIDSFIAQYEDVAANLQSFEDAHAAENTAESAEQLEKARLAEVQAEMHRNLQQHGYLRTHDNFDPRAHIVEVLAGLHDGYDYFPASRLTLDQKKAAVLGVLDDVDAILTPGNQLHRYVDGDGFVLSPWDTAIPYYDINAPLEEIAPISDAITADLALHAEGATEGYTYANSHPKGAGGGAKQVIKKMHSDALIKMQNFMTANGGQFEFMNPVKVTESFASANQLQWVGSGDAVRLALGQGRWQIEQLYSAKLMAAAQASNVSVALDEVVTLGKAIRDLDADLMKMIEKTLYELNFYLVPL